MLRAPALGTRWQLGLSPLFLGWHSNQALTMAPTPAVLHPRPSILPQSLSLSSPSMCGAFPQFIDPLDCESQPTVPTPNRKSSSTRPSLLPCSPSPPGPLLFLGMLLLLRDPHIQ